MPISLGMAMAFAELNLGKRSARASTEITESRTSPSIYGRHNVRNATLPCDWAFKMRRR